MAAAAQPVSNIPLKLNQVSTGYGKISVARGISFDVQAGETFGLIGLNGAGKTTLIKAMLGLLTPQAGHIEVFGTPPGNMNGKKNLAYLPERFEPAWFLNGFEFLRFSLKLYKKSLPDSAFIEAAEAVRLDPEALKRKVQSYSKGMRQKLGLLGTLLTQCPFLILDEPMSGLDPVARTLVKDQLQVAKAKGSTIFLSSHILSDMDEICDRVAILHDGHIQFIGIPADLKQQTGKDSLERAFLALIES